MYLFLFSDGTLRQVHDNISLADLLAVKEKSLTIIAVKEDKFVKFVIDEGKLCPVPVPESRIVQMEHARFHHP